MGYHSNRGNDVGGTFDNMFPRCKGRSGNYGSSRSNESYRSNGSNRSNESYRSNDSYGSNNNETVAGVSQENFRIPVYNYIESEDFCRAVRRCLIQDLVSAGREDNKHCNHHHHKKCCD